MEKELNLKVSGVMELGREELVEINGGGWLRDAWIWTKNAAEDVWNFLVDQIKGLSELV